ncbi:MAG: ABC transporter permease [Alphaproteobacteria bacterium]|nr:ABC transporter permease [Alphaproteobacteria bacterium]
MRALDKKLVRDLMRMWAQVLAIALVLAAGVTTMVLSVGAYQSLEETRSAYYERYRFADVFAHLTRAPQRLEAQIAAIAGVAAVETRVSQAAVLDVMGFSPPVTGHVLSLPDHRRARLNRIFLRAGRLPDAGSPRDAIVNEAFARAHGLEIGSTFGAILNGRKRELAVTGVALSPEFIYAIGPGDLVPDDKRFAVIWMSQEALEEIFDLDGAFNAVSVQLLRGISPEGVIEKLDTLLKRYGGAGAYSREDQTSHAFLDAELEQLKAMSRVLPPIFLFVSAFLINMTLTRLISLEREQIGLFKALGYGRYEIAWHYIKLVLGISAVGIVIGFAFGTYFGQGLTRLYQEFFHFPFLVFRRDPDIYLIAAGLSAGAAVLGAIRAVRSVIGLSPAVAMQPPAPPRYRQSWTEKLGLFRHVSQLTMISLRHIFRWPVRAAMTTLGVALAGALLVVSLFSFDSVEHMIDVSFFLSQRQDATLSLADERHIRVLQAAEGMPGVMRVEPFRSVLVRMRNGQYEKKLPIQGKPQKPELFRLIDKDLRPISLPEDGLVVDKRVAELLRLKPGDVVELEILGGWRGAERAVDMPFTRGAIISDEAALLARGPRGRVETVVTDIVESYFGLSAYMSLPALNRLVDEGYIVSGVHVSYDKRQEQALFEEIKSTPAVASIALKGVSLNKFRDTIEKNIATMITIYVGLAVVVAFGVIYNSARIQLSEQGRELASLRVLGFTRGEVSRVLLVELGILVMAAQPVAWVLGYGFAWLMIQGFSSDLYRIPLVVNASTYAWASLVVLSSAIVSALVVRRRIDRLDLIAVLKTRE